VKDVDGDRRPELLVGLIYKRGAMDFIKTKASLIAFDLNIEKMKKNKEKEGQEKEGKKGETKS